MRPLTLPCGAALLTGALLCSACGTGKQPSARAALHDSAGIAIVDNPAPLGPGFLPWAIDTVPVIDLGARHEDPHEQFSGTLGPLRLSTGFIVVAAGETEDRKSTRLNSSHRL